MIKTGADLHPDATPGLLDGGHEFYTVVMPNHALVRALSSRRYTTGQRRSMLAAVTSGVEVAMSSSTAKSITRG
jgi:hypothetical protein